MHDVRRVNKIMIKGGILGLGKMAQKFAEAIQEVENAKLISISSLSEQKNELFGKKFNINQELRFNTYEKLINCKEVDAIYISTLNNTHSNLIIKSADAGKNILCEKPMAITYEEASLVFNKLETTKVFFLEAIAYRSHPQIKELMKLIYDDTIGKIEKIESSFGYSVNNFLKFLENLGSISAVITPIPFFSSFKILPSGEMISEWPKVFRPFQWVPCCAGANI